MGISLSSPRQTRQHHRVLALADAQHGGGEASPRQGAARSERLGKPSVINTDKAPTYAAALAKLKKEGRYPADTLHRQVKYLNNVIEAEHGKLKQLIRPVRGFKTLKTAYARIKYFEVCQIASKSDPHFASNCDPLWRARSCVRSRGFGENGAVGKWPAGATVESLA